MVRTVPGDGLGAWFNYRTYRKTTSRTWTERARRFAEPGFIVGFWTARPKEYLPVGSGTSSVWQTGSVSGSLNTAKSWVPPVYADEPGESLRMFLAGTGPIGQKAATFDYWLDYRDVYLEGDQFVLGTQDAGLAVPRRDAPLWKYPTDAGVLAMFSGGTAATSVVKVEGRLSLKIAGRVRKFTR